MRDETNKTITQGDNVSSHKVLCQNVPGTCMKTSHQQSPKHLDVATVVRTFLDVTRFVQNWQQFQPHSLIIETM